MLDTPLELQPVYETSDGVAPQSVWEEVAAVFSAAFSVAPYYEDSDSLAEIADCAQACLRLLADGSR